jgi:predicted DNA-binding transcriptional regulator YafY
MRADRLVAMLMLLQARGRMTARELAEELEVSERTVYRDVDALSIAGVPIYAERGPGGGCALLEGYRTNLTGLNEAEVRGLFLQSIPAPLNDLGLSKALEAAMLKLSAALPAAHRQDVELMRQRVHLDSAEWFRPEEPVPYLHTIQDAVWQERRVDILYRRVDGKQTRQCVEPYGLAAKSSIWYFVGAVAGQARVYGVSRIKSARREIRTYRVSRLVSAELMDERFERPADFDLPAYWAEWSDAFQKSLPRYPVTLRVSPEFIPVLPRVFGEGMHSHIERAGPPAEDGSITLTLTFESLEAACGQVLALGTGVEILDPQELRDTLLDLAARVVALYANAAD